MGFVARYGLGSPKSSGFQMLKGKQGRDETTSEVERLWVEVWPEMTPVLSP